MSPNGDCSAIALPLRSANAGTTHSADACHVQVHFEEKIPIVAAVDEVPDKAGKEMTLGAWHRFAPLKRAFYCQKGASKRLNEVCNAPFLQQINELRWPDPNRELVDDARFQIVAARPGAGSRRTA